MIHSLASRWGYEEIRTPILETAELFQKTSGESSDICMKQMYSFLDKGGRKIVLRPEGTPSTLRSLGEASCFSHGPSFRKRHDVYYLGPMFRYERPQSGRYRQFSQFGVETIGPNHVQVDCEVIAMGTTLLEECNIPYCVLINSLGKQEEILAYREKMLDYLMPLEKELSEDSKRRLQLNPLRILDSKDKGDKILLEKAPLISSFLGEDSLKSFEEIQEILQSLHIPFKADPRLVRGLDYYNHIIFEYTFKDEEAHPSLGGGGRYNHLIRSMGYCDMPGIGFSFGLERVMQAALSMGFDRAHSVSCDVLFISFVETYDSVCFQLALRLRQKGIKLKARFAEKNLKQALKECDLIEASWILIYGKQEQEKKVIQVKNARERTVQTIDIDRVDILLTILANENCPIST